MRIHKFIARHSDYSRRKVERLIKQQQVVVNGEMAVVGQEVTDTDKIVIAGNTVSKIGQFRRCVLAYYKPLGEVVTRNSQESVFNNLPPLPHGKWVNVGRLDINSEGLLLFTNDGELSHRLTHPSYKVDREYAVRVFGETTNTHLENLLQGVELEDGNAKFLDLVQSGGQGINKWFYVVLQSGRNRIIRRMWESQGLQVSRLIRVRYGSVLVDKNLKPGQWVVLSQSLVDSLCKLTRLECDPIADNPKSGSTSAKNVKK